MTRDPAEEFDPAWSPDGTKIAFSRSDGRRYQIIVMNADGTDPKEITQGDNSASDAAWSPDGRRIAFTRCSAGSCDIYVMNADGGGEERLTHGERPGEQDPTWSPDGRRIAFADIGGIFVMNADGQDWTSVTDGPADDSNPDWSPVGPQIAFDSSRDLWDGDIYLVDANGSPMTNLTDSAAARFESVLVPGRSQDRLHAQAKPACAGATVRHGCRRKLPDESPRDR